MTSITIGSDATFVKVKILTLHQLYPNSTDIHDKNWLKALVEMQSGGFQGALIIDLWISDFIPFKNELEQLYQKLEGTAHFHNIEDNITIHLTGNGHGHINVSAILEDFGDRHNILEINFEIDQSYIPKLVSDIQALVNRFD